MTDPVELTPHDFTCPHCGAAAEWAFIDGSRSQVQVTCPDCGRFQMDRDQVDHEPPQPTGAAA